jgi:hypothetical protein
MVILGSGAGAILAFQSGGPILLIVLAVLVMLTSGLALSLNLAVLKDYYMKRDALVDGVIILGEIASCRRLWMFMAEEVVIDCVFISPETRRRIEVRASLVIDWLHPYPRPAVGMPVAILFVDDWTYSIL